MCVINELLHRLAIQQSTAFCKEEKVTVTKFTLSDHSGAKFNYHLCIYL